MRSWHQDQTAAPFATRRFATVWLALDEITEEMGPLAFARASHSTDPVRFGLLVLLCFALLLRRQLMRAVRMYAGSACIGAA